MWALNRIPILSRVSRDVTQPPSPVQWTEGELAGRYQVTVVRAQYGEPGEIGVFSVRLHGMLAPFDGRYASTVGQPTPEQQQSGDTIAQILCGGDGQFGATELLCAWPLTGDVRMLVRGSSCVVNALVLQSQALQARGPSWAASLDYADDEMDAPDVAYVPAVMYSSQPGVNVTSVAPLTLQFPPRATSVRISYGVNAGGISSTVTQVRPGIPGNPASTACEVQRVLALPATGLYDVVIPLHPRASQIVVASDGASNTRVSAVFSVRP